MHEHSFDVAQDGEPVEPLFVFRNCVLSKIEGAQI